MTKQSKRLSIDIFSKVSHADVKDTDTVASDQFLREMDHGSAFMQQRSDNRFWKIVCVLLLVILILFLGNNSELSSKLRVQVPAPILEVNIDNETKEYTYKPIDQAHKSIEEITRDYVKEYVLTRESFIPDDALMVKRWDTGSELYWRTEIGFWKQQTARVLTKKLEASIKQNRKRDVQISEPVDFGDGWWQITATFNDTIRQKKLPPVEVTIFLHGKFTELKMPTKHAHHNRIGWVVDKYNVTVQKGTLE